MSFLFGIPLKIKQFVSGHANSYFTKVSNEEIEEFYDVSDVFDLQMIGSVNRNALGEHGTTQINDISENQLSDNVEIFEDASCEFTPLYVVALPPNTQLLDGDVAPFVFKNLKEVVAFSKKYKDVQPRWKQISGMREAEEFVVTPEKDKEGNQAPSKETIPFKSLTPQQMVQFRKYIEGGNLNEIRSLVNSNPRYIIGSCDTPTVLHQGCRYNAFHVAAKANQAAIMEEILGNLRSPAYMKRMFPDDSDESTAARIDYIVDLYLNMPDKTIRSETPLHFACKFGCYECVKFFLDQPECRLDVRNGDQRLAHEIVCERGGNDAARIRELFEDQVVIPILRDDEGAGEPHLGTPVNRRDLKNILSPIVESPKSAKKLSGLVGPITSPQAMEVMNDLLKTKFKPLEAEIRKTDAEKGLETVARNVARKHNVPWSEHWDFLGCCIDLSTLDGLEKLESYLRNRSNDCDRTVYIHGVNPSKTDYHVWSAIQPVIGDITMREEDLPSINKWIAQIRSFPCKDMRTWKTPIKRSIKPIEILLNKENNSRADIYNNNNNNNISHETSGNTSKQNELNRSQDEIDCLVNLMSRFTVDDDVDQTQLE